MAFLFWTCAGLAVLGGLGLVFSKRAVHSALFVALTMMSLAVLYASMQAPFLAMAQIIVYTGAIMMLFLFVLMVVGVDSSDSLRETIPGHRVAALLAGAGLAVMMIVMMGKTILSDMGLDFAEQAAESNLAGLAKLIFRDYVFAFELTSALLITAAVGAMVLAHREHHTAPLNQAELSKLRFKSGNHPGSLPAPGIYARHNAVDTPALLPDGTMAEISVPKPLAARGALKAAEVSDISEVAALMRGEAVITGPSAKPEEK